MPHTDSSPSSTSPLATNPRIDRLGDAALLVTFGTIISRTIARRVWHVSERLAAAAIPMVVDIVPAYTTLAIYYDIGRTSYERVFESVTELLDTIDDTEAPPGRSIVIPVRYDGMDLDDVASQTGLTVQSVIERHSAVEYYTYMLGFVPGFAYLGELDPALVLPRRSTPRQRVPAGSVAIAGAQTAVYPLATPGGWHILGSTDVTMFDPNRDMPALLQPGDLVRFEAVRA